MSQPEQAARLAQALWRRLWRKLWRRLALWPARRRLRRDPLFDPVWYLAAYPDLAASPSGSRRGAVDPAWHYLTHGAAEGRDPGPGFSTSGYRLQGGAADGANPLLDFRAYGRAQGLSALPVLPGCLQLAPGAPVVLFCAHQALGQQFGAERSFLVMLERAAAAGIAPEVVVPQIIDPLYLEALAARALRVRVIPWPWRQGTRPPHPTTVAALVAAIRAAGAVEVHQNTLVIDAPLAAARAAGVPVTVHLRELPAEDPALSARLGLTPEALRAALWREADRFVANSPQTAAWIDPEGLMADRVTILPNSADPALAALPFAPADPPRVGLIGSLVAKKGVADMVALARAFAAMGGRADFVLIGPATADLAALGPLPPNLRHAGYAPSPVAALAQVDVVVSLSHFAESFGRTLLEAMTAGRPVIAYDRGAPPGLIGTGGAGLVVPPDDPAAVAAALGRLLSDPAALQAAAQAARARAALIAATAAEVPAARLYPVALGRPAPAAPAAVSPPGVAPGVAPGAVVAFPPRNGI